MNDVFELLTVTEYTVRALSTDKRTDDGSLVFPLLGLFGETGSLLSEFKKKQRDSASYIGYAANVVEELGDVLWYLTVLASRGGLSLSTIAANVHHGNAEWQNVNGENLTFSALQPEIMPRAILPTPAFEKTLLKLAGEVGSLAVELQTGDLGSNQPAFAHRLISVMRLLLQASNDAGVTLEAAAVKNLHKIFDRWPQERKYPEFLDARSMPEEQLPRDLHVDIFEREVGGQIYVFQRINGINIGDRLTDNAPIADDYRFHDVFHYAYVAVLGWSPVVRSLLRVKRKSDPLLDEVEDGARAILIEEGIATWIFSQAQELNYFAEIHTGSLPFGMLKSIRQFVKGYECDECPLWVWEEAILQGFAAFRFLRQHRRGRIHIDMINHQLGAELLA